MTWLNMRTSLSRTFSQSGLIALISGVLACSPQPPSMAPAALSAPAQTGVQHVVIAEGTPSAIGGVPEVILPAYETAVERLNVAKNDASDDYRAKNKQWFAQTRGLDIERFRPFGEWETMQAVWTTYSNSMPGTKPVRRMYAEQTINFIRYSKPRVKAHVIVNNKSVGADFLKALDEFGMTAEEKKYVVLVTLPNQTIWHIDYGPFPMIERKTGNLAITDFIYYQPRHLDDAIPTRIGREFYKNGTVFRMPFPFEGGNVQSDGNSHCLTSVRALSNTGFSALKMRNMLKNYMACKKTYVVKDITDDGTGHIDMFFKWISPGEVMFGKYENTITLDYDGDGKEETLPLPGSVAKDYRKTYAKNQQRMEDNVKMFEAATASTGKKFIVHRLSMMTRYKDDYGNLPRTFINSTFTNGVNVYPSYTVYSCRDPAGATCMRDTDCADKQNCAAGKCTAGPTAVGCDELMPCKTKTMKCVKDPMKVKLDAIALAQWQKAMPKWKHVGLRADTIATWSGAIHCITRTIPTGTFVKAVPDGICQSGTCGCVEGGMTNSCTTDADCFGPSWMCNCQRCKGKCKGSGKQCTDDADCYAGTDINEIIAGSCVVDTEQTCRGQSAGGGKSTCGSLSYEGTCTGATLKFCSSGGSGAKSLTCPSCCGWSTDSGSYDCLSSNQCGKCIPECSKAGEAGCGIQGEHAWTCVADNGCLKRKWSYCGEGSECSDGTCNKIAPRICPVAGQDAGSTADGGSAVGSDAGVSAPQPDATTDAGAATTSTIAKGKSSGGCSAAPTGRGQSTGAGWLMLMLLAGFALLMRRRRALV